MATIFGLFGISNRMEAGCMTLSEYHLRMKGYVLNRLDIERDIYLQAYLNRVINATDKSGNHYQIKEFSDFYDYNKRREEVLGAKRTQTVSTTLLERAKRVQELRDKGEVNV